MLLLFQIKFIIKYIYDIFFVGGSMVKKIKGAHPLSEDIITDTAVVCHGCKKGIKAGAFVRKLIQGGGKRFYHLPLCPEDMERFRKLGFR